MTVSRVLPLKAALFKFMANPVYILGLIVPYWNHFFSTWLPVITSKCLSPHYTCLPGIQTLVLTWFASACAWECLRGLIACIHLQRVCYGICLLSAGCAHLIHLWSCRSAWVIARILQPFRPLVHNAKHRIMKKQPRFPAIRDAYVLS